jgi:uncharacterized YigZ family protein
MRIYMRESYKLLYRGGTGEIVEKKSRFIADIRPVESEEEALLFIEEIRKKHWDARHHCYAWIIGRKGDQKRCSDDGEPSQTAGKPMLDVLEGAGICNVCAVVTRYFGGTLLGTGGLVRAYSGAVKEGLTSCTVLTVEPGVKLLIDTDYNGIGKIQYLFGQNQISILESVYTEKVELTALVPEEQLESIQEEITEITGGKAELKLLDSVYFGVLDKEVLLFSD